MPIESLIRTVQAVAPFDEVERAHRADVLEWLATTDDVYRRASPATPPKHLVAYFLVQDPTSGAVLLVHHRRAGKWLPTGGHIEPGEDPVETVRREAAEELSISAEFTPDAPLFLTVAWTVGAPAARHVDVSIWYLLNGDENTPLTFDRGEFIDARWWTLEEAAALPPEEVEPHLARFLAKLDSSRRSRP